MSTAFWHKLALTWPVNEKEELIDKFKWPINGYLIPGAPQLKNLEDAIYNYLITSECHLEFYLVKREFWDSWCSNVSFHGNKSNLA